MLTLEEKAEVERVLRSRIPDLGMFRQHTQAWTSEHFDYADTRIGIDIGMELPERRKSVQATLTRLRDEAAQREAGKAAHALAERHHSEALASNREAIKISRFALWISLAAAVVAMLAWLLPRSPN